MRANWTEDETELFKKTYPSKTASQMKELFPQYTWQQMLTKATGLGIVKGEEVAAESRRQNLNHKDQDDIWTDDEKKVLLNVYPTKGIQGVYEALDKKRTLSGIKRMVRRLNVKRNQKHLAWEQSSYSVDKKNHSIEITYKGW